MPTDLDSLDIDKIPVESLGVALPWLSNYYNCPKCKGSVEQGLFGKKDSKGVAWSISECEDCGYIYKVKAF